MFILKPKSYLRKTKVLASDSNKSKVMEDARYARSWRDPCEIDAFLIYKRSPFPQNLHFYKHIDLATFQTFAVWKSSVLVSEDNIAFKT